MTQSKYDQVVEAFRYLVEAGETPTQDKIKAIILENTGVKMSNSTVSKHIKALRASSPDEFLKVAQSDLEPIPADLMPAVTRAVNHLRRTIELSYSTVQVESLEAEIEQLRERLAEAEAIKSELAGLKYAYETQLKRTEELIRENQGLRAGIALETQPVVDELQNKLDAFAVERQRLLKEIERLKTTQKSPPIEELNLPAKYYNCLKRAQINSIFDLTKYTQEDLLEIKNLGQKGVDDIVAALQTKFGITLTYKALAAHQ